MKRFHWILIGALANLCLVCATVGTRAAELIMLEQDACVWCEVWHEEIGVVYHKTTEGKQAPLRIVNIYDEWPEDLKNVRSSRFTPTFVLVEDGKEIARQRGYGGDEFFWFHLQEMLKKLPEKKSPQG